MMDKPRNIFEQILNGLGITNENVVALSEEVAALREDVAYMKGIMSTAPEPTDVEPGTGEVGNHKKK